MNEALSESKSDKLIRQPMTPEMRTWIDQSQGMVRAIATKVFSRLPSHVNYDDLVAYGQLGLLQATHSFDPSKNVAFQTFAYHRIRGAIYDGIGKMSWTSRAIAQRIRAEKLSAEMLYDQVQASKPTDAESAQADAEWLVKTTERVAVVHLLSASADDEAEGLEQRAASDDPSPDDAVANEELCRLLRSLVDELPEPEQTLIRQTYFAGKTLTETAEGLGKSKSWASRLHSRILEKLASKLADCESL